MPNYLDQKLNDAFLYIKEFVGLKKYYNFFDCFKLLKSFAFTKEISIQEINDYLPDSIPQVTSIEKFSKGFIDDFEQYKIFAVNYGSTFLLIIVSSKDGNIISNYYGETINDFTMNIYYCLDIMCNDNPICCN